MNSVRIVRSSHPSYNYEVTAPAKVFGRRVRKRFKVRADAEAHRATLLAEHDAQRLAPLDRSIHLIASRYQSEFTPDQFEAVLSEAITERTRANPPLGALLGAHLDEQETVYKRGALAFTTIKGIRVRVPQLKARLGHIPVRVLSRTMVDQYVSDELDGGLAPRTVRNLLTVLSAVLNQAVRDRLITVNPATRVKLPRPAPTVSILKPDQLQLLINHADPRSRHWMMIGAFAGLRSSEIDRLTWDDIRLDEGQLYVAPGKTKNAERWVTLTPPLVGYLNEIEASSRTGLVLDVCDAHLRRLRERSYKRAGTRIPRNALRHSFGSHHLVEYGNPAGTAMEMGHYSPQQTFAAYRRAVTKTQAAKFWAVRYDPATVVDPAPV